jgi:hypothetical protein
LISKSGAAVLTLGRIWSDVSSIAIILLSLVAAVITFGLFKWELRNVQKCNWLIDRAADMQRGWSNTGERMAIRQLGEWSDKRKPPLFGGSTDPEKQDSAQHKSGIGKTESERIIYWASITAWLIPMAIAIIAWQG